MFRHALVVLGSASALLLACGDDGAGGAGAVASGAGGVGGTGGDGASSSGAGGATGGSGGSGAGGEGALGGGGNAPFCVAGNIQPCYEGPDATIDVGACQGGLETCLEDGSAYGPCEGQVIPVPEDCTTLADDDCDGEANEADAGCVCVPGASESCYEGPANTEFVGVCQPGTRLCAADGLGFGACLGQVLPGTETCGSPADDDCDSETNEEGADCTCVPGAVVACYSGPPGTQNTGVCVGGQQTCNANGLGFGQCIGEITPVAETCNTTTDDDCDGNVNEDGAGCVCLPGSMTACYSGPVGTANVGACVPGISMCNAQGTVAGPCVGEVTPSPETCNTPVNDDCDALTNEEGPGCVCLPNSVSSCYTGPVGTVNVGTCQAGNQTCNNQGTAFGPCTGEVLPQAETCYNTIDESCNGQLNDGCVTTYAEDVQPILQDKCDTCHTVGGAGGANFATSYADSQLPSYYCPGFTKGACLIVRIQNGTMPAGAGCTGNPLLDAGNAACLTATQQSTLQHWISTGQLP